MSWIKQAGACIKNSFRLLWLQTASVVVVLVLGFCTAAAQQRIVSGVVTDSAGKPLPSATIALVNEGDVVTGYVITNESGAFALQVPLAKNATSFWLEVNYIGYKTQRQLIVDGQFVYNFLLFENPRQLGEVIVKKKPAIEAVGDTLKYDVEKFSRAEDRSIGDVLRRMPGMEIDSDGTIYHNGKKISNLYIDGDDLMSGRYGLTTRVIRKEMIVSVDVIKNHQPIKVLKNKVFSDNTAVNLVLKDENSMKLSMNAMLGGGLPRQYDVSLSPLLLSKRLKMLNNIGVNNAGVNYEDDFKQLGPSGFVSDISNTAPDVGLSLSTIGPPNLPLANYYINKSGVVNLNNSFTNKGGTQFKLNVQGFSDRNTLDYYSNVSNYLPGDTILYNEQQSYVKRPQLLSFSLNVMANKEHFFVNNTARVEVGSERNSSFMAFNKESFGQLVDKRIKRFSNDFSWMPALRGKGIGELRWLINYSGDNQTLNIGEGYHSRIPELPGYYQHIIQGINVPVLFSNLYAGFKLPGSVISQEYRVGIITESQQLRSQLDFKENNVDKHYAGDVGNNIHWQRNCLSFSSDYQLKYQKIRSTLHLPLSLQSIHYSQSEYDIDSRNKKFFFNPAVSFQYDFDPERVIKASFRLNNIFSDITGVYRGIIVNNYRTIVANDAGLQEQISQSANLSYSQQKAISMQFFNAGVSYEKTEAEAIMATEIANNIQKTVFLPYRNSRTRYSLQTSFSKYFFGLKTTATFKIQLNRFHYMQIVNDQVFPFFSNGMVVSGKLIKKVGPAFILTYEPKSNLNAAWSEQPARNGKNATYKTWRLDQYLVVNATPVNRLNTELTARHSFSKQTGNPGVRYFFTDAKMTYSNRKKKMDVSFTINNLFNVQQYRLYFVTPNQQIENQYNIRGRMAILRLNYYF